MTGSENGREVVLIEDSRDYAQAVKTMLDYPEGEGAFAVKHFTKLGEALEYVPASEACCLLVDLNLPDATGVEAVNALQAVAPRVPIVVLTGTDDDSLALDAMHAGAQDFLVKGRADVKTASTAYRTDERRRTPERRK